MKKDAIRIKDWDEIAMDFERMQNMSCKPTRRKIKVGTVIDEDKSVRWNREQVEENNTLFAKEVADLNTAKNKTRDEILQDVYNKIQAETGTSIEAAKEVYNYAYDRGHSCGYRSVIAELIDLIDLVKVAIKGAGGK